MTAHQLVALIYFMALLAAVLLALAVANGSMRYAEAALSIALPALGLAVLLLLALRRVRRKRSQDDES
jgi:membrane protein implicated in regulation of membrane protease activity